MLRFSGRTVCLCMLLAVSAEADETMYRYRPYPVLLVHGFNSTPGKTFGAFTKKDSVGEGAARDVLMTSTRMIPDFAPHDDENDNTSFETDHLAYTLLAHLDDDGQVDNQSSGEIVDFYSDALAGLTDEERMCPYEEEGSYSEVNHAYVETYCSLWSYESADGKGTSAELPGDTARYPRFRGGTGPFGDFMPPVMQGGLIMPELDHDLGDEAYDISHDGQTQLLRIRIIQVLNEYYGDWQWVNDPTCRIKIVCHSNGGVITTSVLKNEDNDGWYNGGVNGHQQRWQDYVDGGASADGKYIIDGFGFRLRDRGTLPGPRVAEAAKIRSIASGITFGC